jgi:hypothetical protein
VDAEREALRRLEALLDRGEDPERAAKAALAVSKECAQAWLLLADAATSREEARDRVRRAVEAATRALGEAGLREGRGRLGATPEGVDYLHALAALARHQVAEDRAAQAIQTLQGVLAMDPSDPVSVRGDLLLLLLAEARDDEAEDLVTGYPDEPNADWSYARALLRRRRAEDPEALERATRALDHAVAAHASAGRAIAADPTSTVRGLPTADPVVRAAWEDTEGALDWLRERLAAHEAAPAAAGSPSSRASAQDAEADRRFSAREFAAEAWDAAGGRREELARKSLAIWPDCADAWLALESVAREPGERVRRAREGLAAATRAAAGAGRDDEDARAVHRARATLVAALRSAGAPLEALDEERRLVAQDVDDTTGAALPHAGRLLAAGLDEEAGTLLVRHAQDASPGWPWARVLAHRRKGDGVGAAFALAEAMLTAPLVAPLLLARGSRLPRPVDAGSADAWDHAHRTARALLAAWESTPGALDWLRSKMPATSARSRSSPRRNT